MRTTNSASTGNNELVVAAEPSSKRTTMPVVRQILREILLL